MKFFKDERAGAGFMLFAAFLGFALVNFATGANTLEGLKEFVWPWVSQVAMALFFALIGFELRNEFSSGLFVKPKAVLVPAMAALAGVLVPATVYLLSAVALDAPRSVFAAWPMVTATDVSFALMAFSLLARALPVSLRAFLLSFAVIDDILASIALAIGFWRLDALTPLLSSSLALALAFSLSRKQVSAVIRYLSPAVAFAVLPIFAFFAMQVKFDASTVFGGSSTALILLVMARPLTKWLGVFIGAILGNKIMSKSARLPISTLGFLRVTSLAGIGFTVSLLSADFAFGARSSLFAASASLTVLASLIAAALAAIALRARRGVR